LAKENIHQHECKYIAAEVVELCDWRAVEHCPFIRYIQRKYGELYGLIESARQNEEVRVTAAKGSHAKGAKNKKDKSSLFFLLPYYVPVQSDS